MKSEECLLGEKCLTCHSYIDIKNNLKCFEKDLKLKLIPFRENCEYIRKIAFKNFELSP